MVKTRCKMMLEEWKNHVGSIKTPDGWKTGVVSTLKFRFVAGGSPENKKFWAATPAGYLEIGCANPAALEDLELLKEYYIDIIPAHR